jgi:hypothetical protein
LGDRWAAFATAETPVDSKGLKKVSQGGSQKENQKRKTNPSLNAGDFKRFSNRVTMPPLRMLHIRLLTAEFEIKTGGFALPT